MVGRRIETAGLKTVSAASRNNAGNVSSAVASGLIAFSCEQFRPLPVVSDGGGGMSHKNERVELEIKIIRYRALARLTTDDITKMRVDKLIAELEQKLREIDE